MHDAKRRERIVRVAALGAGLVLALGTATACGPARMPAVARVEIRDYQGEKLGSVDDFHENSIAGPQIVDPVTYRLVIDGLVAHPMLYDLGQLSALEHLQKVVELICVEGWRVKALWEGISIARLLAAAGPLASANTVIFHGVDGYTTSLPLATVVDRDLIVADKMNGVTLPAERGFPLQLVAEDKLGYKWAKWIVRIELGGDPSYRGTWESRGYPNDAEVGGSRQDVPGDVAPGTPPAPSRGEIVD
jgi:DMSO/TMAO reductase YedYZ molybdopterin-dependent catalytic subunit